MIVKTMAGNEIPYAYAIASRSLDEQYLPDAFSFFMAQWPAGQLVAFDPSTGVAGFLVGGRLSGNRASVAILAVDALYRRNGLGDMLIEEFKKRAALEGRNIIQLEVRTSNLDAISFYEKRGFRKTELLRGLYNDGGDAARMVLFSGMC
ncbi:MAG: GNAT family N-acetyltransferase [Candidatus Methanoplasma sp.]|jgi:ribosomal-protein-alanine N-acetyltransferase|nr:GNAT family N-acetyltransferase [Candidatus Methanoplasma sp.]